MYQNTFRISSMELALYVINNTLKCVIPQELDQYAQPWTVKLEACYTVLNALKVLNLVLMA